MGFNAAKVFVNGPQKSSNEGFDEFYSGRIENEIEKVRVVRETVGNHFDLILENHRGMTLPEAVSFGNEVAKYRPMVFEDPVTPDNIDTMAQVAAKIPVPIATGERFINSDFPHPKGAKPTFNVGSLSYNLKIPDEKISVKVCTFLNNDNKKS